MGYYGFAPDSAAGNARRSFPLSISGRLFDFIASRPHSDELQAAQYMLQLLDTVHFLHNCRIAHLDVKVRTSQICTNMSSCR